MGHVTHRVALGMRDKLLHHLRQFYPQLPTPTVTLKKVSCMCSVEEIDIPTSKATYEPEIYDDNAEKRSECKVLVKQLELVTKRKIRTHQ